jgi:tetratricopeptide (TPR) repeat protein
LFESGSANTARAHAEKAYYLSQGEGSPLEKYKSAMLLGQVFARMDLYEDARLIWSRALELGRQEDDLRMQGSALLNIAMLEQRKGNHEGALEILNEVEESLSKIDSLKLFAICCSRKTLSYLEMDKIDLAVESCKRLESIARESGAVGLIASACFRRGTIHLDQDEFQKAIEPFQEAAAIYKEMDDRKNLAFSLCNLASAYIGLEQPDEVELLLKQVLSLANGVESTLVMSEAQLVLAELAVFRRNIPQMVSCYGEALRLAEELNNEDRFRAFHESLEESLTKLHFNIPGIGKILERARVYYKKNGLVKELRELEEWAGRLPQ